MVTHAKTTTTGRVAAAQTERNTPDPGANKERIPEEPGIAYAASTGGAGEHLRTTGVGAQQGRNTTGDGTKAPPGGSNETAMGISQLQQNVVGGYAQGVPTAASGGAAGPQGNVPGE
ncbi:hypothetical protein ACA910_007331 [Epithemia clementina (nom. ined.)]